ncbi:DNA replication regulator SLD3-domain-containing protein [Calycina marina]|uniref:DNA replication regulator SLD3-domain-containing protein n=1 Tax=Calycina marina TaxID=1763456 RepID=A0A9P8CB26_9HELO|nr:DNA replication regulator SLD3-domain-containing protein [Calycina marina]
MYSPTLTTFPGTRQTLTPLSESSQNSDNAFTSGNSGFIRSDIRASEDFLKDPFVVKPYPAKGPSRSRRLQPLLVLPRSHLPLSYLDIHTLNRPLPNSRIFETEIKILDLEERMGNEPMVLIARLDDGMTLYAVEKQDRGLYVLCQLGSWVNIQQLRTVSVVSRQEVKKLERDFASGGVALPPTLSAATHAHNKKKRLAIDAVKAMVKRPCPGLSRKSQTPIPIAEPMAIMEDSQLALQTPNSESIAEELNTQLTATEIFETVRNHYFVALYLCKTSLAYFAKGPLSRARAAFHLDYDATLDMKEYITFLESMVLTKNLIEKKFKDGLPKYVAEIDMHDSADDGKPKKRKSIKKLKPGKNGLYPQEDTLIRKWWIEHDDAESGAPGTSRDQIAKARIAQLRMRETQLQMILILEVLALQPLATTSQNVEEHLPGGLPTSAGRDKKESPVKSKKTPNLTTLMDIHIDRLCIWQSLDFGIDTPIDTPVDTKANPPASLLIGTTENLLRDFCVDIIGPFFSSRLPEQCAAINMKLGGPLPVAPPKPKLSKSASFSGVLSRPGAVTKRAVPPKPRRSLQRVLTEDLERRTESIGLSKAPSLVRSATDPVKREGSEVPSLSGIPAADTKRGRNGILATKHFSRREVDMRKFAPDPQAKVLKQAKADAELKKAIAAIKKPNRELAGKFLAETAQQRAAPGLQGRKSKKPIRNPLFEGVQIAATPRTNRQKDVFISSKRIDLPKMGMEMDVIPPSSVPRIPQLFLKARDENTRNSLHFSVQATPIRRSSVASDRTGGILGVTAASNISVHATPTRKSSLTTRHSDDSLIVPAQAYGAFPPSSPLQQRRSSSSHGQIIIPDSATKKRPAAAKESTVQETPMKKKQKIESTRASLLSTNNKDNTKVGMTGALQQNINNAKDDIYRTLGWDDDDCGELA